MTSKKKISDIVRDKIVEARAKNPDAGMNELTITITDHEACELWSMLSSVEGEIRQFKYDLKVLIAERFEELDRHIIAAKSELRKVGIKKRKRYTNDIKIKS